MESRPRSRRLTTYGSTAKNQPLQMKNAHSSRTNPIPNKSSCRIEGEKTEYQHQRLSDTEGAKIYDLPSSDEEDRQLITRIKRRKFGSTGRASLIKEPLSPPRQRTDDAETKPSITPAKIHTTASQDPETTLPPKRNTTQESHRSSRYKSRARSPRSSNKTAAEISAPIENTERTQKPGALLADDDSPPKPDTRQKASQTTKSSDWSPKSPNRSKSPTHIISSQGTGTPGRRRLVDSLGTRNQSADESSADILTDSQLSLAAAPATPTRRDASVPFKASTGDQRGGESHDHDIAVTISPHLRGSKVTYARQRSFLDDMLLEAESSYSSLPLGEHDPLAQMTQRDTDGDVRGRLLTIEEPVNDDGTVRSIHELRQAGGNARYRGAVDSIFEDLEDSHISISGRCNAFVQLCTKLLDPKLAGQFLECSFDKRLVDLLSQDLDLTSYSLGLCAYDLCFFGKPIPYILATNAWPKLLDIAPSLLDAQDDLLTITRAPRQKISKATQMSIKKILPQLRSTLFPDALMTKLSPCFLLLNCLKSTLSAFQAKGENPTSLSVRVLKQVVNLMLCTTSSQGGNTPSTIEPDRSQLLALGLSILEAHTASSHSLGREQRDVLSLLPKLTEMLFKSNNDSVNTTTRQIQALYIRVILNVTNSHPVLCDTFATSRIIDELTEVTIAHFESLSEDSLSQNSNGGSLDTVILALGALINLTEQSEISRVIFLDSGTKGKSLLGRLLELFMSHVDSTSEAHSVPEVHHNVAIGYLAVLLLALCLNSTARLEVKESLQSKGLTIIISIADEFLQYHRKIERELHPLPVHGEAGGFPVRLQDLISQIQHSES
ncbi:Wings apart-like protein [Penicillium angulare]|uniref:Wings apart-like protein n=1 Tax=Penicillium angulare TaxID=116970 RepID=UPI0025403157|nr:Wings apart-like protein [Penicillium angulare]KAJ5263735.1 Wings apart-like protein [Penicillium angulare]